MLEKTERAIKNGRSTETGNIVGTQDTKRRKQTHNTICVGLCYTQTSTNNVNKTNNWRLRQIEPHLCAQIIAPIMMLIHKKTLGALNLDRYSLFLI